MSTHLSDKDVPFDHPFGFDWNLDVFVDPEFQALVAPDNQNALTPDVTQALDALGLPHSSVMHVETDQDLMPESFRAQAGDRVAVFGRWIVDCGHDPFTSEIHPPLLLACARASGPDRTHSTIVSRPYLVGQEYGDGALRKHLLNEAGRIIAESVFIPPLWDQMAARPQVYNTFSGLHIIHYSVRPTSPRTSPGDSLSVSFHFTVRTGVAVQVFNDSANDAVGILISMNDASYNAPNLPPKADWNITPDQLKLLDPGGGAAFQGVIFASLLANPFAAPVLAKGILTDRYTAPHAASGHDSEVTTERVTNLGAGPHFAVDDGQPFPIYGWLDVQWNRAL